MSDEPSYWGYAPSGPVTSSEVATTAVTPPVYNEAQIQGLLTTLAQPEHAGIQASIIGHVTEHGINDPQIIAGMIDQKLQSINQSSVNNEASLVMGGYDPGVATAVAASAGVGTDQAHIQQAAADFAREAARAVSNGQTLEQVRTADPNLSLEAQQAIYEQVAQQQGTSAKAIEEKAAAAKQETMSAIQSAVFGTAALATGAAAVSDAANYNIFTATAAGPAKTEERPYGVAADRMPFADMGNTTAAIAMMEQFRPQAGLPDLGQDRGQSIMRG